MAICGAVAVAGGAAVGVAVACGAGPLGMRICGAVAGGAAVGVVVAVAVGVGGGSGVVGAGRTGVSSILRKAEHAGVPAFPAITQGVKSPPRGSVAGAGAGGRAGHGGAARARVLEGAREGRADEVGGVPAAVGGPGGEVLDRRVRAIAAQVMAAHDDEAGLEQRAGRDVRRGAYLLERVLPGRGAPGRGVEPPDLEDPPVHANPGRHVGAGEVAVGQQANDVALVRHHDAARVRSAERGGQTGNLPGVPVDDEGRVLLDRLERRRLRRPMLLGRRRRAASGEPERERAGDRVPACPAPDTGLLGAGGHVARHDVPTGTQTRHRVSSSIARAGDSGQRTGAGRCLKARSDPCLSVRRGAGASRRGRATGHDRCRRRAPWGRGPRARGGSRG